MNRRELLSVLGLLSIAESLSCRTAKAALPAKPTLPALREAAGKRWAALGFAARQVTVGGTTLYVALAGKGPAVVLLHGYPQSGEIWRKIAPTLVPDHQVIVPDLPGMGLSDAGKSPHTMLAAAEAIGALLQGLGVSQAALVGHDWGGAVAATVVADREAIFLRYLWEIFTGDKAAAPFADWAPYVAALCVPGRFTTAADYYRSAYGSAEDTTRLLTAGKLSIPVLPIAGAESLGSANEAMARKFASNVRPGLVLSGAGHFVPEERATEASEALRVFIS